MTPVPEPSGPQHWEAMADTGLAELSIPVWRRFCDELHQGILSDWTAGRHFASALKTDLFDEAVGEGLFGWLSAVSDRVEGIDVASGIVAQAAQRHPGLIARQADVRHLEDHSAGSFDLIVSNSTLDHFPHEHDLTVALCELARTLRPGGLFFVTLDNPRNPVVALRNRLTRPWMGSTSLVPYFMGHTVPLAELTRRLTASGLQVERTGYLMHVPRLLCLHACRLVSVDSWVGSALLRCMHACELWNRLPTRCRTGHFSAVLARKPTR
jgi:SAM-dependent methyltransferase